MLNLAAALAAFAAGCIVMHCSKNNPDIVGKLEAEGIDFLQFAFRWVNCLLIREVPFNAAIRLWDTYLAEGGRFSDFLVRLQLLVLLCGARQTTGHPVRSACRSSCHTGKYLDTRLVDV
jgi:hypothetical protein